MIIKWVGHSCFSICDESLRVLTDPFAEQLKYTFTDDKFDLVTISHQHFDHNSHTRVKGEFKLIDKPGAYEFKNLKIEGIESFHDQNEGKNRGKNIIFKFEFSSGINILHMGDIGHILSRETVEKIGRVNIIMIPVGGVYTVDFKNAAEIVKEINPDVIIPMHFKTKFIDFDLDTEHRFVSLMSMPVEYMDSLKIDNFNLSDYCGKMIFFNI